MHFGPAGNSRRFYDEGFKKTEQAPEWLAKQGLDAFEYPMGRGVNLSEPSARAIGRASAAYGIRMSVHAPYFINCASADAEGREKSVDYLLKASRAADWLGATRVVFHIGSPGKLSRAEAFRLSLETVASARDRMDAEGLSGIALCPETMGRPSQMGSLDEVLALCETDPRHIPTLDFGHLHVVGQGALNSPDDFRRVLGRMVGVLGYDRAKDFHIHFSRIDYGPKGEKRHMNFSDEGYGPDFRHLAPVLAEMGLEPVVICESAGDQADDALFMRRAVLEFKEKNAPRRDCEPGADMV